MAFEPVYIELPNQEVKANGWYVCGSNGKIKKGPFDTKEGALSWINARALALLERIKRQPPPSPFNE